MSVALHFILLAIGEVLKINGYVTPQKLQDFIANEDSFGGYRIPLDECRLALNLMEQGDFIEKEISDRYIWKKHFDKYNDD